MGADTEKLPLSIHSVLADTWQLTLMSTEDNPPGYGCEYLSLSQDAIEWTSMQAALDVPRSAEGRLYYYPSGTISVPTVVRFGIISSCVNTALSTVN